MRVTKIEKVTDDRWINLYAATFEHRGHTGRWVYASRKKDPTQRGRPDAVVMVPVLHEEGQPPRLVMLREFRVPIDGYSLAFPAGLLEEGESVEEAVRRELLEETGYEVIRFRRISPPVYSSTGLTDESAVMAFIDVRAKEGNQQKLDASEDLEVKLFDIAEVSRLCDDPGPAIDAKAWSTLYMYKMLGRLGE
jgi:ADP-ribose pyrophosphatase